MNKPLLLVALLAAAVAAPAFAELQPGDDCPELVPSKAWNDGGRKSLADFRGEFVHLVFWTTW